MIRAFILVIAALCGLAARADAAKDTIPRNVLKADFLAVVAGNQFYGASYERVPYAVGIGFGDDIVVDTSDLEAPEVVLDVFALGFQWRYYLGGGLGGRHGFYSAFNIGYTHGTGTGRDGHGVVRDYVYDGYEVSILTFGYQAIFAGHLAIDLGASFRQALGSMRSADGDRGTAGGWGFVVTSGLGVGF